MRIRFIYPAYDRHTDSNPEIRQVVKAQSYLGTPSLSIAILASLTPQHHHVEFLDDRVEEAINDDPVDLVALPVFTPAAQRAMAIARAYRQRGVQVVAGGIFPSLMPQEMAPHVDAVCIGEGEEVWPQILADAEAGHLQPLYQAPAPYDLARSILPRYDLYMAKEGAGYPLLDYPLQISRGCPLQCVACAVPAYMGHKVRLAPPELVAQNFLALAKGPGRRGVCLTEDISSLPTARVSEHMEACVTEAIKALADHPPALWPRLSYIGASPMQVLKARPAFFDLLRKMDAIQIYLVFGFCSVSRRALQADHDQKMFQAAIDSIRRVHDEGLIAYCSLPAGHDEEDEGVFDRILELAERAQVRSAEFVILTPYPGTPLYLRLKDEGRLIEGSWRRFNDANVTFRPQRMTPERLKEGYIYLWHEFYRHFVPQWPIQV